MNSLIIRQLVNSVCIRQYSTVIHATKLPLIVQTKPVICTLHRPLSVEPSNDDNDGEGKSSSKKEIDKSRDRRIPVDLDLSIEYMKSDAFRETYRDYKIWQLFRRNFKGYISPSKPRIRCVEDGFLATSNPCVICRDRYLVVNYKNIDLLKHFISPQTGYVYPNTIICLCSEQYEKLCVAVTLAKSYGLIDFEVPLREYNYGHHYHTLPVNFRH